MSVENDIRNLAAKIDSLEDKLEKLTDGYSSPIKRIEKNLDEIEKAIHELEPSNLRRFLEVGAYASIISKLTSIEEQLSNLGSK